MERNASLKSVTKNCHPDARRSGNGNIVYTDVKLLNEKGEETVFIRTGERCKLVLGYKIIQMSGLPVFAMGITSDYEDYCYGTSVDINQCEQTAFKNTGTVTFSFQNELLKGRYYLDLRIQSVDGELFDVLDHLMLFEVCTNSTMESGLFTMPHSWFLE